MLRIIVLTAIILCITLLCDVPFFQALTFAFFATLGSLFLLTVFMDWLVSDCPERRLLPATAGIAFASLSIGILIL